MDHGLLALAPLGQAGAQPTSQPPSVAPATAVTAGDCDLTTIGCRAVTVTVDCDTLLGRAAPHRPDILDRNGRVLTTSKMVPGLFADPAQ